MPLHFDILTIFPDMFAGVIGESIVSRAAAAGLVSFEITNIRDFATGPHRSVDDRPYGGGPGMVFKPEPVFASVESVLAKARAPEDRTRKLILTPQGRRLEQRDLRELCGASWIVLLCGHYEGFDERILEGLRFEEISIGDYVLSGGEIPAMVIVDGVVRLLPGALGHPESAQAESFEMGLLDHPHYTRPPEFRGMQVPEVLISGNHRKIEEWRKEQSLRRTLARRGDLVEKLGGVEEVEGSRPGSRKKSRGRASPPSVEGNRTARDAGLGGCDEAAGEGKPTGESRNRGGRRLEHDLKTSWRRGLRLKNELAEGLHHGTDQADRAEVPQESAPRIQGG